MSFNVLSHLWPKVGGGDLEVGLVSRVVAPENAVMGLAHGLLPVPGREVQGGPGIVEVAQSNPDKLVFVLK
jgi:hypothetical protein